MCERKSNNENQGQKGRKVQFFFHKIKKKGILKRKHWEASTGYNMHITDE